MWSGSGRTFLPSTTTYSARPPWRCSPMIPKASQSGSSPRRQDSQRAHRHAIADLHPPDAGPDLHHVAGNIGARPEGERRLERREAVADPEVQVVQCARADAQEDLARPDDRVGDVFVAEDVRAAELSEGGGL